ncbi:hypothetical protein JCM1840_000641 [Sporobolomyces johnsonii]
MTRHPRSRRAPLSDPHRVLSPRASCSSSSDLYSYPASTDTLPVYEDITLTWDPSCVSISSSSVDLYLSVEEDSGLLAVHEWTGVDYSAGKLATQFKPTWWNASTGAGSVQAQLALVPSGSPSWDTPAPSGPMFTISYNGSYPSVTQSAISSNYTGPSVESAADNSGSSSPTGGKLGAAIGVPLIVVAIAVVGYVTWNRLRKRPDKKRFSAVVDQRMSMISQGTWQPRPSMASRPGSFHPSHRPSGSMYSTANRHSYFADPTHGAGGGHQRGSTYSGSGVGVPSPLRPPAPAEMRQIGAGERVSRVSFATAEPMPRPSFASSRPGKVSSIYTRSSLHQSQLRHSTLLPSGDEEQPPLPYPSPTLGSGSGSPQHSPPLSRSTSSIPRSPSSGTVSSSGRFEDCVSRSGTREELASLDSSLSLKPLALGHAHKPSATSSLRNELSSLPALAVVRDGDLAYSSPSPSPFADPSLPLPPTAPAPSSPLASSSSASSTKSSRPKLSPIQTSSSSFLPMPRAFRSSQILSPDEALASYARDVVTPPPPMPSKASVKSFFTKPGKMLRSLTAGSLAGRAGQGTGEAPPSPTPEEGEEDEEEEDEEKEMDEKDAERAKSPFEDPAEAHTDDDGALAAPQPVGNRLSAAPTIASAYSQGGEREGSGGATAL